HVVVDPSAPQTLYAGAVDPTDTADQGVWKSTNCAATWTQLTTNFTDVPASWLYIELAIAPSATSTIYAVVMTPPTGARKGPLPRFYRSTNGGTNWGVLQETANDPDNRYWHQPLTVHPQQPDTVYAEGVNHDAVFTRSGCLPVNGAGVWNDIWEH